MGKKNRWNQDGAKDNTQRPVFVYGTLRHGQGNWRNIIAGKPHTMVKATINDHALYPMSGFPYALEQDGAILKGEVVDFPSEVWDQAIRELDSLEGYHGEGGFNLYDRRVVTAYTEDGEHIEVYLYVAQNAGSIRQRHQHYEPGDWIQWRDETRGAREMEQSIAWSERRRREAEKRTDTGGATLANGVGASFL